jgi:hypothetical protein
MGCGVWAIDRSEVIDAVLPRGRALVLRPEHYDARLAGGEAEKHRRYWRACHDAGGWFHGLFDENRLIGAAVLKVASSETTRINCS